MELCNIVQEAVIKNISKKKKCKKENWLSQETLQIAEKRREAKSKREKDASECRVPKNSNERYEGFLSDQCKKNNNNKNKLEENNRMGKTRDLFKKIQDTKGTFHAKMDTIKDRNVMDIIE